MTLHVIYQNDVCGSWATHIRITHSLAQNAGSLQCSQVLQCSLAQVPFPQLQPESTWASPTSCVNYHWAKINYLISHFPACSKGPIHIANGLSLNHHLQYISGLSQWPVLSHTSESYHPLSLGLQRPHSKILFEQDRSSGEVSGFAVDMLPAEAGGSHIWSQTGIHGWKPALVT